MLRVNGMLLVFIYFIGLLIFQLTRGWAAAVAAREGGIQNVLRVLRPIVYTTLIVAIIVFDQEAKAFVYFQF
jgi:hypothetical protein